MNFEDRCRSMIIEGEGSVSHMYLDTRGFGDDYVLVLLNGERLPADPLGGDSATNLNLIPIAMVERVEYLSTGASAIYGADAVQGKLHEVRTTLDGVDRIGEGIDRLGVRVVPLQGQLDDHALGLALDQHGLVELGSRPVEVLDEFDDATLVPEGRLAELVAALVVENDLQPTIEESELA